ncbi:hypothetical protein D9V41_05760 [Aeromicrobium phragmitis]|uniref:Uncharacterized protein n=1 Tax=Aeromicrobium phragmitis TaxID=2478914 RepID=A0A3L8PQ53_9ACTN|nr:hypothetical protein [Aeromicrobium phragmitis]RLV56578.1 hypothetical protein D9V41_05760 [Aeromicrobium phragmitis]
MLHRGRAFGLAMLVGVLYALIAVTGAVVIGSGSSALGAASAVVAGIGLLGGWLTTGVAVLTLRATRDRDPDDDVAITVATLAGSGFIAVFGFLALRSLGAFPAVLAVAVLTLATHVVLRRGLPRLLL